MEINKRFNVAIMALAVLAISASAVFAASVTSESSLTTAGVQKSEVSAGDLVADAIRSALGADFAFISASELKGDVTIPKGTVSTQDITGIIAYTDDTLVLMKLTGRQIKQSLERSVLIYPKNNLGFLQVSGLRFTFDPSRAQEDRVTSVLLGDKGDKALQDNAYYTAAMTSSMANGALGYWKIWSKDNKEKTTDTTIPQAVDQFFSSRTTINYSVQNRITAAK